MRAGAIPIARRFPTSIRTYSAKRSITGKAIYDVQAFHKILTGRFPEQRLLSHDLIEGAHVGVGLATDVELFEQFPYDYTSYSKRQHRWIRGDWQIASWILPRVPDGQRTATRTESADADQSLEDPRQSSPQSAGARRHCCFLICSWIFNAAPTAASALVALVLLVPLFFQLLQRLAQRWRGDVRALHEASSDLNRAIVMAAFLPHQAYLALDAIVRACYRLWVSRRHLLEWQTAEMSHLAARAHLDAFRAQFFLISALAAVFLLALDFPRLLLGTGMDALSSALGCRAGGSALDRLATARACESWSKSTSRINAISDASREKPGATSTIW